MSHTLRGSGKVHSLLGCNNPAVNAKGPPPEEANDAVVEVVKPEVEVDVDDGSDARSVMKDPQPGTS